MRLPPPLRKYSPISVMACTPATVSRPNSPSSATRSSRSRSNTSFPLMVAGALNSVCSRWLKSCSICSVVRKLQIDPEIVTFQQRNRLLQGVAILAADAHQVSLNGGLRFLLRIFDQLHDLPRFFDGDALLHGHLALGGATRCRLNCT